MIKIEFCVFIPYTCDSAARIVSKFKVRLIASCVCTLHECDCFSMRAHMFLLNLPLVTVVICLFLDSFVFLFMIIKLSFLHSGIGDSRSFRTALRKDTHFCIHQRKCVHTQHRTRTRKQTIFVTSVLICAVFVCLHFLPEIINFCLMRSSVSLFFSFLLNVNE